MNRDTWPLGSAVRLGILISATLALALQLFLAGRAYPIFAVLPLASTAAALVSWRRWPGATVAALLLLAATSGLAIRLLWGAPDFTNGGVWLAPLLAVAGAAAANRDWSLPPRFALPLGFWGLCIALAWPIVVLREADFGLALLLNSRTAITSQGVPVPVAASWIAHVAAVQMIAVLWADALHHIYRAARERFERDVVLPIAAALVVSAGVGLYQIVEDITFLNPTPFGGLNRATGLLLDGNAFGIVTAMLAPMLFVLALRRSAVWRWLAAGGALGCLVCVWGSGSRTALLAAGCAVPFSLIAIWAGIRSIWGRFLALALALLLLGGVGAIAWDGHLGGPRDRIELMFQRSKSAEQTIAEYLWKRDGYGPSALRMLEEHPLVGVGVGSFHFLVLDYSRMEHPSRGVGSDNAQNWLRQVLAEFGVLGSAGAVAFAMILGAGFLKPVPRGARISTWLVRSALIGVGAASLFGVPTQHAFVLILFFTLIVWQDVLAQRDAAVPARAPSWTWAVVVLLAVGFAGGTYAAARDDLRVPYRAARFGWPYYSGYYGLETPPGAEPFRWTGRRAKASAAVPRGYLKLTYAIAHEDAAERPVRVRIWRDGALVIDESLPDRNARTAYLFVKGGKNGVMLETEVDRLWTSQGRDLGVAIAEWEVVARPPDGARVIN